MSKENEKPAKDVLGFIPLRWRDLLQRLASKDRRGEVAELLWLIESYASGRLSDQGDKFTTPRIPLDGSKGRAQYPRVVGLESTPEEEPPEAQRFPQD